MAKRKGSSRIYRAASKAPFDDSVATWIGSQIEKHGNELKPERLVELSRPRNSPGHRLFVWDNDTAADRFRYDQACYFLRHVEIEIVHEGNKQPIRACFPVFTEDREAGSRRPYVSYDKVLDSPDLARQVVEKAAHELKAWQRRYALYKNVFSPVFTAIEEMELALWPPQQQSTAYRQTGTSTARIRKAK